MTPGPEPPEVLRRAAGALGGEVVLRVRRNDSGNDVYELVTDGVFAMDTVDTSTERLLASATLDRLSGDDLRVVVAGLGLGFTLRALLDDDRVRDVHVVELEAMLVEWLRDGVLPVARETLRDPRVRVQVGDVRELLPAMPEAAHDCVLLDVDNGPGFLVHGANAPIYRRPFLRSCLRLLRPGGVLAIWSADPAPDLRRTLDALASSCDELPLPVRRDGRTFTYLLYLAVG